MSYGTCQLPLRVFVFFIVSLACLSPLGFLDFFVVLLRIRGFMRSEFVHSCQLQLVCRYVLFIFLSSSHDLMYCTLSITVGLCTSCQKSKPHQHKRFFLRGVMTPTLTLVRPGFQ